MKFFAETADGRFLSKIQNQIIIAHLAYSENGSGDIEEPLDIFPQLWNYDPESKKRRTFLKNNEISGRQEFPEMYTLYGGVFIAEAKYLQIISEDTIKHDAFTYTIDHSETVESQWLMRLGTPQAI